MSSRPYPRRSDSTRSMTSSNGKSIINTTRTTTRRRSSASNHHPTSPTVRSRARSRNSQASSIDSGSDDSGSDQDLNGAEGGGDDEVEAGPSDYWRRSPSPRSVDSPPPKWREASDGVRAGDVGTPAWGDEGIEDGRYDEWRPDAPTGRGKGTGSAIAQLNLDGAGDSMRDGRQTWDERDGSGEREEEEMQEMQQAQQAQEMDYFGSRPGGEGDEVGSSSAETDRLDTNKSPDAYEEQDAHERQALTLQEERERLEEQVDDQEYERRMRDVFDSDTPNTTGTPFSNFSPAPSMGSIGLGGVDRRRGLGRGGGNYEMAYEEILGEKAPEEEEFGTLEFPPRDDVSEVTTLSGTSKAPIMPSPLKRNITPYLHPSVSRLRSHLRSTSTSSITSTASNPRPSHARIPSHFSQISLTRSESTGTLSLAPTAPAQVQTPIDSSPAFTFHPLRSLSAHLFGRKGSGRSSPSRPPASRKTSGLVVDEVDLGRPMVMDVHGFIAVGTAKGYVVVYGFGQEIKHVLGPEAIAQPPSPQTATAPGPFLVPSSSSAKTSGAVTTVKISPDQTYVAVGHSSGNIHLYDLASPSKPARTTLALTLKQVLSGRKEGHLQGSRILHIGFVGPRHTSIVSGDEHGRAFWWSLGKVLGVESNDVVRMLGSYPDVDTDPAPSYPAKKPTTLFGVHSLPLGDKPHGTDQFHLTVMLTPVKLVVVGMKPSAKTWYRKMRGEVGGSNPAMGCATWLRAGELDDGSDPVLAYSWGSHVRFLRIKVGVNELGSGSTEMGKSKDKEKDKVDEVPEFVEGRRYDAPNGVLALQWYDSNHLLIVTTAEIVLLDVRTGQAVENTPLQTRLLTSHDFYSGLASKTPDGAVPDSAASSIRAHRGKLFLLTQSNVQVGTLQHWNDRILSRVHAGDFLSAIQVALGYYEATSPGNYIGLPEDPSMRQEIVGARIRELMRASLEWAFSEERMRDDTHYSANGRGVDLTALFEGLASCCIEACLAMVNFDYLFEDTYDAYANAGIGGIFLGLLEGFIFDGRINVIPPGIVQALIGLHDDRGELEQAEAVIWHVDPLALDINQAVMLCEEHKLWDALVHVYTRAMRDWTAPMVKLIRLVYDLHAQRTDQHRPDSASEENVFDIDEEQERDAYKLFTYIEHTLSGLSYPSNDILPTSGADHAKAEIYAFLFADRSIFWPPGEDGKPVLPEYTAANPHVAYPYLDLLLRFDPEAFLHAMDIAFEDGYLNDNRATISRQTIINIMLDLMSSTSTPEDGPARFDRTDLTLLHIFISKNLPKYPQFLFIPPSTLHSILVGLAGDPDENTREDRQLATEYLLSAYTPHDADEMLKHFEHAGFWRVLRGWYVREGRWADLVRAWVADKEVGSGVFDELRELTRTVRAHAKMGKSHDGLSGVKRGIEDSVSGLLGSSVRETALLLDGEDELAALHDKALDLLNQSPPQRKMAYLRTLLQPEDDPAIPTPAKTGKSLSIDARHTYIDLLMKYDQSTVISFLDTSRGTLDLGRLTGEFKRAGYEPGEMWAWDARGETGKAFEIAGEGVRAQAVDLAQAMLGPADGVNGVEGVDGTDGVDIGAVHQALGKLSDVTAMSVRLCRAHTLLGSPGAEDWWFSILSELMEVGVGLDALSPGTSKDDGRRGVSSQEEGAEAQRRLVGERIRSLITDTLSALVSGSVSSSRLSFPRLFKRLVDSSPTNGSGTATVTATAKNRGGAGKSRAYAQFRSVLTSMLDSYRTESEVLRMTTRLVQSDLFELISERHEKRGRGWRGSSLGEGCGACGESCLV